MKRSFAVGFLLLVGTLGVGIACSFPSPDLLDVPIVPTTDGPLATDAPSTTTPRPDGSISVPPDSATDSPTDVIEFDADPPPDASVSDGDANVVGTDGEVVNCDEDKDSYRKIGGSCGGPDCDDTNMNVRPNQDYNTLAPIPGSGPGKGGDWNCNGAVEVFGNRGVDPTCPGLVATGCVKEGFEAVSPVCGSMSRYVKCTASTLGCAKTFDQMLPVSCR